MASRAALTRLAALPRASAPRALSTAASSTSLATSRAALAATATPRVARSEARFLVGKEQRRAASSDEGAQTMVRRQCGVGARTAAVRCSVVMATAAGISRQRFPRNISMLTPPDRP